VTIARKTAQKSFKATLERGGSNLGWTIVRIPFDVAKIWGSRGSFRVKGEINGFAFRTSLFPEGKGRHFLLVNKRMQAGAGVRLGGSADIELEPDTAKRKVIVPAELKRAISEDRALVRWFDSLNYSMRKWICDWVSGVKSAEARVRRSEQVAEQLLSTMEAELELPPLIRAAFAREPGAKEGWQAMSPRQRRGQLLAIFYYRNPASRERRLGKVIEQALAVAKRKKPGTDFAEED
jgi:uncharacterized protein YdeI (YjbR/CyaY-like superfamily)